jgi:hypothetical protein
MHRPPVAIVVGLVLLPILLCLILHPLAWLTVPAVVPKG